MSEIICNGKNITQHVAAMYDAIIQSLDWGSNFLDTETVESILVIGRLAGFKLEYPTMPSELRRQWNSNETYEQRWQAEKEIRDKWQAQVDAMLQAKIADMADANNRGEEESP